MILNEIRTKEFAKFDYVVIEREDERFVPIEVKNFINSGYPRFEELPTNKGYVAWRNGEFILETLGAPSFHFRQENENFWQDTGIKSWINENMIKKLEKESKTDEQPISKSKTENTHFLCSYAVDIFMKEDAAWENTGKKILEDKEKLINENAIPEVLITAISSLSGKSLNNKIRGFNYLKEKLDKFKFDSKLNKKMV